MSAATTIVEHVDSLVEELAGRWTDANIRTAPLEYAKYLTDDLRAHGLPPFSQTDRLEGVKAGTYRPGSGIDGRKFITGAMALSNLGKDHWDSDAMAAYGYLIMRGRLALRA